MMLVRMVVKGANQKFDSDLLEMPSFGQTISLKIGGNTTPVKVPETNPLTHKFQRGLPEVILELIYPAR